MVVVKTSVDVIIAAKTGAIPRKIIGKNRKIKQMKLNIKAIADLTPFGPPTKQSNSKKILKKIYIGIERSIL